MTQEQINELRKLAQAATQGKWEYTHGGRGDNGKFIITEYFVILEDDDVAIAADIVNPKTSRPSKENAAYIAAANPVAILELIAQLRAARGFLPILKDLVADIQGLMSESEGVAGLHRNGDVAPWDELEPGGRFERLGSLQAAIEVINKAES